MYVFSQMLINVILEPTCKSDVDVKEMFIKYMCKPNKNHLIPMRHLYHGLLSALEHLMERSTDFK